MTDDNERSGGGFLLRQPLALLGAIALLSLAQDLMQWQENINAWLNVFQSVTRPVWDFLFGWLFDWIGWKFPGSMKDYLTVGLFVSGVFMGINVMAEEKLYRSDVPLIAKYGTFCWLLWPIIPAIFLYVAVFGRISKGYSMFAETGIWALIISTVNYALLYGGA